MRTGGVEGTSEAGGDSTNLTANEKHRRITNKEGILFKGDEGAEGSAV